MIYLSPAVAVSIMTNVDTPLKEWIYQYPSSSSLSTNRNPSQSVHNLFFHHENDRNPMALSLDLNNVIIPSNNALLNPKHCSLIINNANHVDIKSSLEDINSSNLRYNVSLYNVSSDSPINSENINKHVVALGITPARKVTKAKIKNIDENLNVSDDMDESGEATYKDNNGNKFVLESIKSGSIYHIPLEKGGTPINHRSNVLNFKFKLNSAVPVTTTLSTEKNINSDNEYDLNVDILLDSKVTGHYVTYLPKPFYDCILSVHVDNDDNVNREDYRITSISLHKMSSPLVGAFTNNKGHTSIYNNMTNNIEVNTKDNGNEDDSGRFHNVNYQSTSLIGQSVYQNTIGEIRNRDANIIRELNRIRNLYRYDDKLKVFRLPNREITKNKLKVIASELKQIKKQIKAREKLKKKMKAARKRQLKIYKAAKDTRSAKSFKKQAKTLEKPIKTRFKREIEKPFSGMKSGFNKLKKLSKLLDKERKEGGTVDGGPRSPTTSGGGVRRGTATTAGTSRVKPKLPPRRTTAASSTVTKGGKGGGGVTSATKIVKKEVPPGRPKALRPTRSTLTSVEKVKKPAKPLPTPPVKKTAITSSFGQEMEKPL